MSETCKNGHPTNNENLYVSPGGIRKCRACDRTRAAAKRELIRRRAERAAAQLRSRL